MENKPDQIVFTTEDGEEVTLCVIEQTRFQGVNYLLVTPAEGDEEEEEGLEALILKDISNDTDEVAVYEPVEDENELELLAGIFRELVDDIELY